MNRLLWLTDNYPPQRGGMSQSCDRIVHGLRKRGFQIDVVHFANRSGDGFKTIEQINGSYTLIPFEESESHTLNRGWNVVKKMETDQLICFGGYLSLLAGPIYAKWIGKPLITLLRGNDFDTSIFTPRKRDILIDALTTSEKICVVSKEKQWKIKQLLSNAKVEFVPNGIDVVNWTPSQSEIEFSKKWREKHCDQKLCIGLFGHLKPKKGGNFLIESLKDPKFSNNLHFLFIGDLDQKLEEILNNGSVSFSYLPFMDRFELLKYYLCCDAMAIPSFYDGMPNVLLEAGGLGIPVIATAVDGIKDVIHPDKNGMLFEPGDLSECRFVFHKFIKMSSKERQELGIELKKTIEIEYNEKNEIDHYIHLFNR
ncbi:glycosyltransferase family 4 protein [Fulvivirgaceae bacterium BMA10]|uniref:Glycosyltransferase family 4 protein n=1 Tax=Splendidivirga corallicola TaxID=3051826 RepID=A0ABT8KSB8_9BACT|nr:glycosyltransferase family 4 protein [Fulvivirgaceae bacterium BMA10]